MCTSPTERTDGWTALDTPERVVAAVRKLERMGRTEAELAARRRYLDLLAPCPGERIVDVGAGTGLITLDIAARVNPGGRVVAVDPSAALLDHARGAAKAARLSEVFEVEVGDGRALPFANRTFHAAFCHWVLLHVDAGSAIVRELKRVTRPGGRVVCVEMDWETAIVYPGERALTRRILNFSNDRHVEGWSGRRLTSLFKECGFVDVVVEPIVDVDQSGDAVWLDFVKERAQNAVEGGIVSDAEARAWTGAIEAAAVADRYFFAITQFAVLGHVPT
jgi:ubiquinone/menaquinone biosynthesis C-methylase UbiE